MNRLSSKGNTRRCKANARKPAKPDMRMGEKGQQATGRRQDSYYTCERLVCGLRNVDADLRCRGVREQSLGCRKTMGERYSRENNVVTVP